MRHYTCQRALRLTLAGMALLTAGLLVLTGGLVALGVALIKKGSPPLPKQAIEEAKLTTEALRSNGSR